MQCRICGSKMDFFQTISVDVNAFELRKERIGNSKQIIETRSKELSGINTHCFSCANNV